MCFYLGSILPLTFVCFLIYILFFFFRYFIKNNQTFTVCQFLKNNDQPLSSQPLWKSTILKCAEIIISCFHQIKLNYIWLISLNSNSMDNLVRKFFFFLHYTCYYTFLKLFSALCWWWSVFLTDGPWRLSYCHKPNL